MVVRYCVRAAVILGGGTQSQTGEVLFHGIPKSVTTWPSRFAAILAFRSQAGSEENLENMLRQAQHERKSLIYKRPFALSLSKGGVCRGALKLFGLSRASPLLRSRSAVGAGLPAKRSVRCFLSGAGQFLTTGFFPCELHS